MKDGIIAASPLMCEVRKDFSIRVVIRKLEGQFVVCDQYRDGTKLTFFDKPKSFAYDPKAKNGEQQCKNAFRKACINWMQRCELFPFLLGLSSVCEQPSDEHYDPLVAPDGQPCFLISREGSRHGPYFNDAIAKITFAEELLNAYGWKIEPAN